MTRPVVPTLALAAALLAACGGDARVAAPTAATASAPTRETTTAATATRERASAVRRGKKITAVSSRFGRILADGRGQAVYVFAKEASSRPECYGACARAWPPVLTKGRPVAGRGARSGRLGTTRRRDGTRQVTVNGRPAYYYVRDAPGRVLCHNVQEFGGLWLVVRPDGAPLS